MGPALQLAIIIFCIIMSAYFSATETAFSTFNRIRVKNAAEKGNKRAKLILDLADNYDTLISTILVGNNIVNIACATVATIFFVDILTGTVVMDFSATISTAVTTVVVLIFGEVTPKSLAKKIPEKFASFSAPLIKFLSVLFVPLTFVLLHIQKLLGKLVKNDEEKGMTEEELISIIEEAEEGGDFGKEESTLIKSAIEFNELDVSDIFTPRVDITAVSVNATKEEVRDVFRDSGFSRLPVYDGDVDNIIGIVYYKDFYNTDFDSLSEIVKPVLYVAKSQKINDLLKELQNKQLHLAIVMDEFGSTIGIVTLEDIVEEIVGEIWDEHDEMIEEIKQLGDKEYSVSGKTSIYKLFDMFDIDEEADAQTVAGWAMTVLGKIPQVGDEFRDLGLYAQITEMNGKRVESLRIVDERSDEEEDGEESEKENSKNQIVNS